MACKIFFFFFFLAVACELLVAACGISFSDQGSNWVPLHWEHRVLGTRSPRKSPYIILYIVIVYRGLPWLVSSKESDCNAGDPGSIPGLERFPGRGRGSPLQYCCLENPMGRGAWRAAVQVPHRVKHD